MLNFSERGQGPALVLVHAFPLDRSMWQGQVDFFSSRYRVITPDVFGFGGSQPPRFWTIADMGDALGELLDHLGVQRCTLVGLSMGGYISLPFTLKNPQRVERLVLAHTRARSDTDAERNGRNDMIDALKKDGVSILPARMIPRLLGPNAPADVKQSVSGTILRSSAEASIHAVTAMRDRLDQVSKLSSLTCPVLVITGDADAIIKVEDSQNMAAAIPSGKLVVMPGTGHLSNLEDPPAFNQALEKFLRPSDSK